MQWSSQCLRSHELPSKLLTFLRLQWMIYSPEFIILAFSTWLCSTDPASWVMAFSALNFPNEHFISHYHPLLGLRLILHRASNREPAIFSKVKLALGRKKKTASVLILPLYLYCVILKIRTWPTDLVSANNTSQDFSYFFYFLFLTACSWSVF